MSAGAWATLACSRMKKGCRSMAGTTWSSSGTPSPWILDRGAPSGPAPVAPGSLAEPHTLGWRRGEPQGENAAGQGQEDIKSPHLRGCPGSMRAPCSLSVAPLALAPPCPVHRDVTEQNLLEAGVLSPTHPQLIHGKLSEGTAVSLLQRPNLGPSA